jgi:hypothetical protein
MVIVQETGLPVYVYRQDDDRYLLDVRTDPTVWIMNVGRSYGGYIVHGGRCACVTGGGPERTAKNYTTREYFKVTSPDLHTLLVYAQQNGWTPKLHTTCTKLTQRVGGIAPVAWDVPDQGGR